MKNEFFINQQLIQMKKTTKKKYKYILRYILAICFLLDVFTMPNAKAEDPIFEDNLIGQGFFFGKLWNATPAMMEFDPTDFADIVLWLDGEDIDGDNTPEGLSESGLSGSEVAIWVDKSGQGNDVTGTARPDLLLNQLNGKPTLDFDLDYLVTANTGQITPDGPYTKIVVFKYDVTNIQNNLISSDSGGTAFWGALGDAVNVWHVNSGTSNPGHLSSSSGSVGTTAYHIAAVTYDNIAGDGNLSKLFLDGTLVDTDDAVQAHSVAREIFIGSHAGSSFLNGKMAEALVYNRALTDAEIACLEGFLSTKWGITVSSTPGLCGVSTILDEVLEDSASPGGSNNANSTAVTASELALITGITGVDPANEASYQAAIASETGFSTPPTVSEVQAIIDAVNDSKKFITTWTVTADDLEIFIPTHSGGYNYTVDWGDGTVETNITALDYSHTYADISGSPYTVKISGDFPRFFSDANNSGSDQVDIDNMAQLASLEQWGTNEWVSMNSTFSKAINMTYNATDAPNLTNVTSLDGAFVDVGNMNDADFSNWDVSTITDMRNAFAGAGGNFSGLDNWNVSNVTRMQRTFFNTVFNGDISAWDVGNVTNFSQMFRGNSVFNQDISNWNMSNATNLSTMFLGASAFNQNLNNWERTSPDVSTMGNVTNFVSMFGSATSFNGAIGNWNTSQVTNMSTMFTKAIAFNQPLTNWDTSNVENMRRMFNDATAFNQPLTNWDTSNVENMSAMFFNATAFNQDLSSFDMTALQTTLNQDSEIVDGAVNMLGGTALSVDNYDATLIGWASQSLAPGGALGAGGLEYCSAAMARATIEAAPLGWVIIDDSKNCNHLILAEILEDSNSPGGNNNGNGISISFEELSEMIGLNDEIAINLSAYQSAINAETNFSNPPTVEEVQAIIDAVNNQDDDNDGLPNYLDPDDNNPDTDGDGIPDGNDVDVDGDGINDNGTDSDGDGINDASDIDSNPNAIDSDGDGIIDDNDVDGFTPPAPKFEMATALTPNGDGINDGWVIPGIENFPNSDVRVYNRSGREVFQAFGYQNDWEGEYKDNSSKLPPGSYHYVINLGDDSAPVRGWIFINY